MRITLIAQHDLELHHFDVQIAQHWVSGTWTLIEPPKDQHIIGSKQVLHIKQDDNGSAIHFKACVVARGFSPKFLVLTFKIVLFLH